MFELNFERCCCTMPRGFYYIYSKDFVHMDLKAGNIFLTKVSIRPTYTGAVHYPDCADDGFEDWRTCSRLRSNSATCTKISPICPRRYLLASYSDTKISGRWWHHCLVPYIHVGCYLFEECGSSHLVRYRS